MLLRFTNRKCNVIANYLNRKCNVIAIYLICIVQNMDRTSWTGQLDWTG